MATQHCTECGVKLKAGARFCQRCGTAVSGGKPSRSRKTAKPTQTRWPLLAAIGGGVLLTVVALVLVISGGGSPQTQVAGPPADDHDAESLPYPTVERITAEEAYAMVQQGEALIVDVRDQSAYAAAHAAGALSLPEEEIAIRINELPRDQLIITYCT